MAEAFDNDTFELESLIRRAGEYADVSADLKPRIVRAARRNVQQTHFFKVASVAALVFTLTTLIGGPSDWLATPAPPATTAAELLERDVLSLKSSRELMFLACTLDGADGSWGAVEVFRQVHQRHREIFQFGR